MWELRVFFNVFQIKSSVENNFYFTWFICNLEEHFHFLINFAANFVY